MSALIGESPTARLRRLVPGAVVQSTPRPAPPTEAFRVIRPARAVGDVVKTLSVGATEREAIERALFLYGSQR